jgi:hypothetical protein
MIQVLAGIAVDRRVPFHSIIGDRGLGDGEQGSDGVVPYKSAHLEGAESELIVPSDHAATAHPFTVLEVKRILKLHLLRAGRLDPSRHESTGRHLGAMLDATRLRLIPRT